MIIHHTPATVGDRHSKEVSEEAQEAAADRRLRPRHAGNVLMRMFALKVPCVEVVIEKTHQPVRIFPITIPGSAVSRTLSRLERVGAVTAV